MTALLALMKALDCLPHLPKQVSQSFSHLSFGGGEGLTRVIFTRGTSVGLPPMAEERSIQ